MIRVESISVAQQHAVKPYDLTDNLTIDALCGTAAFNGTWVEVESAVGTPLRGLENPVGTSADVFAVISYV